MKKHVLVPLATLALAIIAVQTTATAQTREDQTVRSAVMVLDEVMAIPAKRIPAGLLAKAEGVAIIPNVVKGGFVVGIRHGRGVILVRDEHGNWQPPMFATMTGGSVGWQAGLQATDVVLVFNSRRSVQGLMRGKFTLGVDAAAAAGPVGRQAAAATDARLQAEILSYSRSRGLFAGVSLDGSVLQMDNFASQSYYGPKAPPIGGVPASQPLPASAAMLMGRLQQYSGGPRIQPTAPGRPKTITGPITEQIPAPPGSPTPGVGRGRPTSAAALRSDLVASWRRVATLLDERWKRHLELPYTVMVPGSQVKKDELKKTLAKYDSIQKDARYSALTSRPEFISTHKRLRDYLNILEQGSKPSNNLNLPPPPGGNDAALELRGGR